MRSVRARAHASIANLGYGFDVFALCVTAGFDEVQLSLGGRGSVLVVEGEAAAGVPRRASANSAGVALAKLLRDHGITRTVRARLRKGVPAGGLGSSGASAVAAVVAANRLLGLGLTREALVPYAAHGETASAGTAHADNVAASLFGGLVVVERLAPARILRLVPRGALRIAIARPQLRLTTAAARRVLPRRLALEQCAQACARAAMIVAALQAGDVRGFGRALEGSLTDRARAALIPGFAEVCASARRAGAAGATVSGAGPAVMAAVDAGRADPRAVAAAMRAAFGRAGLEARTLVARVGGGARVVEVRR